VRMRSRKPCVLARRRLFGWKVRLLTCTSLHSRLQGFREPERWLATVRTPGSGHGETGCCQAWTRYVGPRTRVKPECRPLPVDNSCGESTPLSSPLPRRFRRHHCSSTHRRRGRRRPLAPAAGTHVLRRPRPPPGPRRARTWKRCSYQHSEWPIGRGSFDPRAIRGPVLAGQGPAPTRRARWRPFW
jgi:hypothetical protein